MVAEPGAVRAVTTMPRLWFMIWGGLVTDDCRGGQGGAVDQRRVGGKAEQRGGGGPPMG
jgi:hypothetical protein